MSFTTTQIKAIQTVLRGEGLYNYLIDGVCGPYTVAAVKTYQKKHGLLQDGIVGPITAKSMNLTAILFPTPTPAHTPIFSIGYFINPDATPMVNIDFKALKSKGITEVYIRATNSGTNSYTKLAGWYKIITDAGLKPFAWTWQGFAHSAEVAKMGYHICLDMETYNMSNYLSEIRAVRNASQGKTLILCTKADGWDGDQKWSLVLQYCDAVMPMLYLGDYHKTLMELTTYMKIYNTKYPGKVIPALETYVSDAQVTAKTKTSLASEINAVKPYCKGVALFRYGIGGI